MTMVAASSRPASLLALPARDLLRRCAPALLMPLAVLAVHQLRYWLAFGADAGRALGHSHGYLAVLTPLVIGIAALAFGGFLGRLVNAWRESVADDRPRWRFVRVWLAAAAGLLAIYCAQEMLESIAAGDRSAGLRAMLAASHLWAIVAALAVGAAFATLVRGARRIVELVARAARRRHGSRRARHSAPRRPRRPSLWRRPCPLATTSAERAPPHRCGGTAAA